MWISAALPTTGKRHNTEGTHIVTTTSDRNKSSNSIAIEANRGNIGIGLITREKYIDRITTIIHFLQEIG